MRWKAHQNSASFGQLSNSLADGARWASTSKIRPDTIKSVSLKERVQSLRLNWASARHLLAAVRQFVHLNTQLCASFRSLRQVEGEKWILMKTKRTHCSIFTNLKQKSSLSEPAARTSANQVNRVKISIIRRLCAPNVFRVFASSAFRVCSDSWNLLSLFRLESTLMIFLDFFHCQADFWQSVQPVSRVHN